MNSRTLVLLGLFAGLCACAVQRGAELPAMEGWEQRAAILGAIDAFEFSGRVAVQYGDDGFNGKLHWSQDGGDYDARLSGPLGIGTVLIHGSGNRVAVTDKDGETTVLDDAEADLYHRYGWTIPVTSLRYWALGIPDPRQPASTRFAAGGELEQLEQGGWTVAISRYREVAGGERMPARLTANNPGTRVRLVIDRWTFADTTVP